MRILSFNNNKTKLNDLIDIKDLQSRSSLLLLEKYKGRNPYLINLRNKYLKNGKISLTQTQDRYVNEFYNVEPQLINRLISINNFLGEQMKEDLKLTFTPQKILVEFMLAETEKSFHVYGKLTTKQPHSQMYWLPKTMVLDDPYFEEINVDVDFEKYNTILREKRGFEILPHQEIGIKFLLGRKGAILADSMGVAKTLQAVVAALEVGAKKILIVCPSSVKISWEREIQVFDDKTCIVDGRRWRDRKFTIINYDILRNFHTVGNPKDEDAVINRDIVNANFDLVIIDEAHKVKDKNSGRGEIMSEICTKYDIERVWLLTGTPVANRPMDFYNLLKLIKSPLVDNWKYYAIRYCEGKQITTTLKNGKKKKIWVTNGASNLEELHRRSKNLFLRRLLSEVTDMPEKIVTNVYHKMTDNSKKEYESLWDEYLIERARLKKKGSVERDLVELGLLRKFIAMEAIPNTIELVKNAIEEGEKVVIFTTFKDEQQELEEAFGKQCVVHNGDMNITDKQYSVDAFQNNPKIRVFIGNINSAGVGITLTSGTIVVFNSFSWVPGDNAQAEDRIWRLGQRNNCRIYYQLFIDTISIRMLETVNNKSDVINIIVGDTKKVSPIEMIMEEILSEYEGK